MANSQNKSPGSVRGAQQNLNAEDLASQLIQLAEQYKINTWCLAYSGGVDSQVLLHLLHLSKLKCMAVYIDHGLQPESIEWARHCEYQCQQFKIPFKSVSVDAQAAKGESPEAAARNARYNAFRNLIKPGMCLLTAQHQNDQAETVLLQLLRGGSAAGCAAMPRMTEFASAWHCRPLLGISQSAILDYAESHRLSWVEDPSNQQQNYDRNFLRHSVLPVIQKRWPALTKTLSVFSEQQAENAQLLDQLAEQDLSTVLISRDQLDIPLLRKFDDARLRNVLRYWVRQNQKPVPSRAVLQQIVGQIQGASHDTHARVSWAANEIRRFRDRVYLLEQLNHDASQVIQWAASEHLYIPSINTTLSLQIINPTESSAYLLDRNILTKRLYVRFRQGGERIKPAGRDSRHDLKSLFQEAAVPAWERDRIPLLYADDELLAVMGYWIADEFAVKSTGVLPVVSPG